MGGEEGKAEAHIHESDEVAPHTALHTLNRIKGGNARSAWGLQPYETGRDHRRFDRPIRLSIEAKRIKHVHCTIRSRAGAH